MALPLAGLTPLVKGAPVRLFGFTEWCLIKALVSNDSSQNTSSSAVGVAEMVLRRSVGRMSVAQAWV